MTHSRRDFLGLMSVAAGGMVTGIAMPPGRTALQMDAFPEVTEAMLRDLALRAVDEARRAGASFADVRLASARSIKFEAARYSKRAGGVSSVSWPYLDYRAAFGIRAIVDGAWGFMGGYVVSPDAVVVGAREAVASARANRPRHRRSLVLAPEPAEPNGFWEMPIERDPFTVSIGEQTETAAAALASLTSMPEIVEGAVGVEWRRCTSVFASTEGSLIVQRLSTAIPSATVTALGAPNDWSTATKDAADTIRVGPYGYEALGAATLAQGVRAAAERAIELAKKLRTVSNTEVGRYDLVVGPLAVATLLTETLAAALDLPRALGYEANGIGTSFAAPPLDFLGKYAIAAPMVTIHGDRTQERGASTVAWDDEGVKPSPYTFVTNGMVTDYHTNRQTAVEIGDWYRASGKPVRAQGLTQGIGRAIPELTLPNITMEPGKAAASLDDMVAGTKRGYYVHSVYGRSDQQVINTQVACPRWAVRKITNGKLGDNVADFSFQFITQPFWKSVTAIGGAASVRASTQITNLLAMADVSQPFPFSTYRTVPMQVRKVNVLNTGRTA